MPNQDQQQLPPNGEKVQSVQPNNQVTPEARPLSEELGLPTKPNKETPKAEVPEKKQLSDELNSDNNNSDIQGDEDNDNIDDSQEQRNKNRQNYEKRQQQKLLKQVEALRAEISEIKGAKKDIDPDVISQHVERVIAQKEQQAFIAKSSSAASDFFESQDYAKNPTSRQEFIDFMKNDPSLSAIWALDPKGATELADLKFRQSKGLSTASISQAKQNAQRSGLFNSGGFNAAGQNIEAIVSEALKSKDPRKAEEALKAIK